MHHQFSAQVLLQSNQNDYEQGPVTNYTAFFCTIYLNMKGGFSETINLLLDRCQQCLTGDLIEKEWMIHCILSFFVFSTVNRF